jgi:hypothetical protein
MRGEGERLMARIRSIKPEAPKSLTLASWPREVRLFWHYLSMYLDDRGRGIENYRTILGECFPWDQDVTEKKVQGWIELMLRRATRNPGDEPALCRYEIHGERYIHAPKWKKHQRINRPTESRLPACPIHEPDGLF